MNLVIDIGNTQLKYGIFENNSLVANESMPLSLFNINEILKKYPVKNSIICSVAEMPDNIVVQLKSASNFVAFNSSTLIPIKNLYQSQSTLGSDRLAAAIGAFTLYPNQHVLVIDTGTCIKYNFITNNGEFLGGSISPGIDMRFKALNTFTHKLPLVNTNYNFNKLIGSSTEESILSGVLNGTVAEVQGIIEMYNKQYTQVKIVITGGNHAFFAKHIKSSIFAHPFLLLSGLNAIVEFNASK